MATMKLSKYAASRTQVQIAEDMKVTPAYVSLMMLGDREIYIDTDRSGFVRAWEKKPIPATTKERS